MLRVAVGDDAGEERQLATGIAFLEAGLAERDLKLAERVELVSKLSGSIQPIHRARAHAPISAAARSRGS